MIGRDRMAVFDELEGELRVYDHGVDEGTLEVRRSEAKAIPLEKEEPLLAESEHFLSCIRSGGDPISGGAHGVQIVRMLELATQSLEGSSSLSPGGHSG